MPIHPTAIIHRQAEIDSGVEIGPFTIIDGPVHIGAETRVRGHAYLSGWTQIGRRCDIHPFSAIGNLPQDYHFSGEPSHCRVGDDVVIREGVSVHRGTQPGSETIIGDGCMLMAYSHVGHNCRLGPRVILTNSAQLAGHVEVGERAILSAVALVHQFVRIGKLAFISGAARITMDVPPFMVAYGTSSLTHHNVIGMRRAGYDRDAIREIREAYRLLFRGGLLFSEAVRQFTETATTGAGRELVAFLTSESRRGVCGGIHRKANQFPPPSDLSAEAD